MKTRAPLLRKKTGEFIPSLNLAPFGRWTLRDKTAQRGLALG
jgi:hypothetical protein